MMPSAVSSAGDHVAGGPREEFSQSKDCIRSLIAPMFGNKAVGIFKDPGK